MKRGSKTIFLAVFAILCLASQAALGADVADLLAKMPTKNPAETRKVLRQINDLGTAAFEELCGMLTPTGDDTDREARYALSGLALYVNQEHVTTKRRTYALALAEALSSPLHPQAKTFIMQQLQYAGKEEVVAPLGKFLTDDYLCEPATQALLGIRTKGVVPTLLQALPTLEGGNRVTVIRALGDLQDKDAAKALLPYTKSLEQEARWASLYAVANIGASSAAEVIAELPMQTSGYERAKANEVTMLYVRRLVATGEEKDAVKICRKLIKTRTTPKDNYVRCAALATLVDVLGHKAMPELIATVRNDEKKVRAAALKLAAGLGAKATTAEWNALTKANAPNPLSVERRAEVVAMLGHRGKNAAIPALTKALRDDEKIVRLAAIPAVSQLAGAKAIPALIATLKTEEKDEIALVTDALSRMPGDEAMVALAEALPNVSTLSRVALLNALAARTAKVSPALLMPSAQDDDRATRVAAWKALRSAASPENLPEMIDILSNIKSASELKEARLTVVAVANQIDDAKARADQALKALAKAKNDQRPALLSLLSRLGGKPALDAVVKATKSADKDEKDAAVRALADWSDAAATPALLALARNAKNTTTHKVLALRGAVRLTRASDAPEQRRLATLNTILSAAKRPEEKKLALDGMGDFRSAAALKAVVAHLDNNALKAHALAVAVKIALPRGKSDKGLQDPASVPALKKVLAAATDAKTRAKIEAHLKTFPKSATEASDPMLDVKEGFTALFNGKDMTGWVGNTKGYIAEDGKIIVKPKLGGGNLFTEREYADFHLRFEFKLTPGANNGLGIRAPLQGNAAYEGMELQILDNTADKYKDLKKYQYHGSIYGVVAADYGKIPAQKGGYLKPVGEWNYQEVIAKGRQITVKLNGKTIVDADLDKASANGTKDGRGRKGHPGLSRKTGHIGFLGHGSPLEFRNLRIKDLGDGFYAPPKGYTAIFNGKNLKGWVGLLKGGGLDNPIKRDAAKPDVREKAERDADDLMRKHWSVVDGNLFFDGKGYSLCTNRDYTDFEMFVDWKISSSGDSGLYLRGAPQVQIWDPNGRNARLAKVGSGGLFNNQKNPSKPLHCADHPVETWNNFRIKMVGEKVTVHLNGVLVVDNVVLENYWDRKRPIFPSEQIELQCHGDPVYFRNIFIRDIK